jgi:hypothetical protein
LTATSFAAARRAYAREVPRRPRHFEAGIYQVAAHGSDTRYLFVCDLDRIEFIDALGSTFWQRAIELLAYTLMGNHYHALVLIPDKRLGSAPAAAHRLLTRPQPQARQRRAPLPRPLPRPPHHR